MTNTPQTACDDCSTFAVPAGYEFIEKLGEGAHGIVIKAKRLHMGDVVAIKTLKSVEEISAQRFRSEATAVGRLSHENIAKALLFGTDENQRLFIVYEYVAGDTLKDRLSLRQLDLVEFKSLFTQLLSALSYAHANGLVHRDIKPSNIMLSENDEGEVCAKLLDFGIAKNILLAGPGVTQTNEVVGTPEYMSPEQCRQDELDERSDLYAVGCVMYECLTGEPPLHGENPMHSLYRQMSESVPSLQGRCQNLGISRQLARLIDSCLEKNRDQRPRNAQAVLEELQDLTLACASPSSLISGGRGRAGMLCLCSLLMVPLLVVLLLAASNVCAGYNAPKVRLGNEKSRPLSKIGSPEQWLRDIAKGRSLLEKTPAGDATAKRKELIDQVCQWQNKYDKGPRSGNGLLCASFLLQAMMLRDDQRSAEAEKECKKALECCFVHGKYASRAIDVLFIYVAACFDLKDRKTAAEKVEEAISIVESDTSDEASQVSLPANMPLTSQLGSIGRLYLWRAEFEEATDPLKAETDLLKARKHLSQMRPDVWRAQGDSALAQFYFKQGKQEKAVDTLKDLRADLDVELRSDSPKVASAYKVLGSGWHSLKRVDDAIGAWEIAIQQWSRSNSESAEKRRTVKLLSQAYEERGEQRGGAAYRDKKLQSGTGHQ